MSINNLEAAIAKLFKSCKTSTEKARAVEELGMLERAVAKIDLPIEPEVEVVKDRIVQLLQSTAADLEFM